jgi:photosystem II stability/assembly factor-like uncharacterized protein
MTQKIARIFRLGICLLILGSLLCNFPKVSAGICEWSAEPIPATLNNLLGPTGVDIRDLAFFNDGQIIYAAPGNSVSNTIYRSTDGGNTWTTITIGMPINVDLIATMPDNDQVLAIANKSTPAVYLSVDAGLHWKDLGILPGGAPAVAIYDLAISPQREDINYIAVAGKEAGNVANLWYFELGSMASTVWHQTKILPGFVAADEAVTLAFSPTFVNDATVAVITNEALTNVKLQLLNIGSKMWNNAAGYIGFPREIVSAGPNPVASASLALGPEYVGYQPEARNLFIGLAVVGNPTASGIYRLKDTVLTTISANITINSIAFNGADLVAGSYDHNTVYACHDPYEPSPTIQESDTTKSPGGEKWVVVAWMGGMVVAGTSGNESAFAICEDNGFTFNDISLIDTIISNAEDAAVAEEGNKIYLVTDDTFDLSVWLFNGVWQRVLNKIGIKNYIVRIAGGNNSDSVYLAENNTNHIYYSRTGGTTHWYDSECSVVVQDLAVESPTVIYAIDTLGMAAVSKDGGVLWIKANTNLNSGATIVSVSANVTLAGSQNGFVAYTFNGGLTWANIPQIIETGAGKVQVVVDENFAENKMIYAASDKLNGSIMRWVIGTSNEWTDVYNGTINGGIYGLAITNNVIYALEYDAVADESTLWRHLSPATIPENSTEWSSSTITNDIYDGLPVRLNAKPQALKFTTSKLWAVRTNGVTNKFYSYTDVLADTEITLLNPIDGYCSDVSSLNGIAYDVTFSWERPSVATKYEFTMAQDEDFVIKVVTGNVTSSDNVAHVTIGPYQSGAWQVFYVPGVTYYWKVRVISPSYSVYSETRDFTVQPVPLIVFAPIELLPVDVSTLINPSFSWYPLTGVTEYQFMLSDNPEMVSPLIDVYLETTTIKTNITLEYGKNYFWRVKPSQPMVGYWSALGTFIMLAPVETETVTVTATAQTVYIPFFITFMNTPGYLVGAITIALTLIGIIFVLLFSHRNVNISRGESMKPQLKLDHYTEFPGLPIQRETIAKQPTATEMDKEGPDIIFGAKSFLWMVTQGGEVGLEQPGLSEKERNSLGKKLANRIHELSKKGNLYVKYREDAAMLLAIWAEHRSKKETNNYLVKSFDANPFNAVKFLKCYLPTAQLGREPPTIKDFDLGKYDLLAEVVETGKVYETLTKLFKFKAEEIEDIVPVMSFDRELANQFMRLHVKAKGVSW